jgi:hypothetical protein
MRWKPGLEREHSDDDGNEVGLADAALGLVYGGDFLGLLYPLGKDLWPSVQSGVGRRR